MKIFITGGHVTPALAVIDELKKISGCTLIFVGRKYALVGDKTPSFEYQEVQQKNVSFVDLETGRLTRFFSLGTFFDLIKIPIGIIRAFWIVLQYKPDRILSFGGYIAFPICLAGFLQQIPIVIHEQTMRPGLTNRVVGMFAKSICLSFQEAGHYFNQKRTVITGNPLRGEIFTIIKKPFELINTSGKPVIFVTGGSTGAHALNICFENILEKLLADFIIIHQTGGAKVYNDFERLSKIKHANYHVTTHFSSSEIGYIYSITDIVVSRAGANTVFELIALKKPSILMPLPISAGGEQIAQAQLLKQFGVAEICRQEESIGTLVSYIYEVIQNKDRYRKNFEKTTRYTDYTAAQKVVQCLTA